MSDFNPYRDWLDIQPGGKLTYYQLLGIRPLESDAGVVRRAGEARCQQLLHVDTGGRDKLHEQLTDKIAEAVNCLSNPISKAAYDQLIRREIKAHSVRQSQRTSEDAPTHPNRNTARPPETIDRDLCIGDVIDQAVEPAMPGVESGPQPIIVNMRDSKADAPGNIQQTTRTGRRRNIARSLRKKSRRSQRSRLTTFLIVVSLSLSGLLAAVHLRQPRRNQHQTVAKDHDTSHATRYNETSLGGRGPATPLPNAKRTVPTSTEPPNTTSPLSNNVHASPNRAVVLTPGPSESTERDQERFHALLRQTREQLARRATGEAANTIAEAQPLAVDAEQIKKWNRLSQLTEYATAYWECAHNSINKLEGGDELLLGANRVIVVKMNADSLIIRMNGKNRELPINDLPLSVTIALAERWLAKDAPSAKVLRGAMMATTRRYSDKEALHEWKQAEATEAIDLGDLPLVLEDRYD